MPPRRQPLSGLDQRSYTNIQQEEQETQFTYTGLLQGQYDQPPDAVSTAGQQ